MGYGVSAHKRPHRVPTSGTRAFVGDDARLWTWTILLVV